MENATGCPLEWADKSQFNWEGRPLASIYGYTLDDSSEGMMA